MESFNAGLNQSKKGTLHLGGRSLENLPSQELLRLPKQERERIVAESASVVLSELRATGAIEYSNMAEMYSVLGHVEMVARRESPERIIDAFTNNTAITIDFPDNQRYSNAVIWNADLGSRGLANAYLEGYGQLNSIVSVIGFKAENTLDIERLPDATSEFAGLDRMFVRSVKGDVKPESILFVSVRIPISAFPETEMTEQELENKQDYMEQEKPRAQFIHRGFLFSKHLTKQ